MSRVRALVTELRRTVRTPSRLRNLADRERVSVVARRVFGRHAGGAVDAPWYQTESGVWQRRYASYDDYRRHQESKLGTLWLASHDERFRKALRDRLAGRSFVRPGTTVLCLAARLGTEVKAFHDLGCFAVGIDLMPGKDNPYVLVGDFHALVFPDGCVDLVYTNSVDHALDLPRLLGEIRRVLEPDGRLLVELGTGTDRPAGEKYEATQWTAVEEILAVFTDAGFALEDRTPFDYPWPGELCVLRR